MSSDLKVDAFTINSSLSVICIALNEAIWPSVKVFSAADKLWALSARVTVLVSLGTIPINGILKAWAAVIEIFDLSPHHIEMIFEVPSCKVVPEVDKVAEYVLRFPYLLVPS